MDLVAPQHVESYFPSQGLNLCPLPCKVDSYPLDHQGSPLTPIPLPSRLPAGCGSNTPGLLLLTLCLPVAQMPFMSSQHLCTVKVVPAHLVTPDLILADADS